MPRIALGPAHESYAADAIRCGGGSPVTPGEPADGLVWLNSSDVSGLRAALAATPEIRWVQLPAAGVERIAGTGLFGDGREWTCAKGAYAQPVAEHALTLALAGLRLLQTRTRARSWGSPAGTTLFGQNVVILGGGGITRVLIDLLAPFQVNATVVRRTPEPVPGATSVVTTESLHEVLPDALVVFLALALTPETTGIIGAPELALMGPGAWLVNVARGRHVVTSDLIEALANNAVGGAALDVTDPEPLPDGHPLWSMPNCIITPHTADTPEMCEPLLADRIARNVAAFAAGQPLDGMVDPQAGY